MTLVTHPAIIDSRDYVDGHSLKVTRYSNGNAELKIVNSEFGESMIVELDAAGRRQLIAQLQSFDDPAEDGGQTAQVKRYTLVYDASLRSRRWSVKDGETGKLVVSDITTRSEAAQRAAELNAR